MYAVFAVIFLLALFSCAVSGIMGRIWLLFFKPKKRKKAFSIVYLDSIDDEKQMLYYCEKLKWYGKFFADTLVFVYSEKCSPYLKNLANKNDNVIYCSVSELMEFLK